jgi:hypothetical protein
MFKEPIRGFHDLLTPFCIHNDVLLLYVKSGTKCNERTVGSSSQNLFYYTIIQTMLFDCKSKAIPVTGRGDP